MTGKGLDHGNPDIALTATMIKGAAVREINCIQCVCVCVLPIFYERRARMESFYNSIRFNGFAGSTPLFII